MDQATQLAYQFVTTFNNVILFPTLALMSAVALLIFIYGCFEYVVRAADPAARTQGIKHITWGIVGLVVMLSAYTIMTIVTATFGLSDELDRANDGLIVVPPGSVGGSVDVPGGGIGGGVDNPNSVGGTAE